jgi:hypothetical protein
LNRAYISIAVIETYSHQDMREVELIVQHIPTSPIILIERQQTRKDDGERTILIRIFFPLSIAARPNWQLRSADFYGYIRSTDKGHPVIFVQGDYRIFSLYGVAY